MGKFSDFASDVGDLRRDLDGAYEDATEAAMDEMSRAIELGLRKNRSVAREVLAESIRTGTPTRQFQGRHVHAAAVKMPDWARYLEHGTGKRGATDTERGHEVYEAPDPGPPLEDILTWVVAKNIQPRNFESQHELATAIQEVIAAKGTFPHPFYRPAWYSNRKGYENVVDENHDALKRELRRL